MGQARYGGVHSVSSLLTNTDKKNRALYEKAIRDYKSQGGKLGIYISEEAYCSSNTLLKEYIAIHTKDLFEDHSEFWRVYEKVKRYEEVKS